MKGILNITNGDCSVAIMKEAGIPGDFLPWRDVLHEGPVPDGLDLEALSRVRAGFIAARGWAPYAAVLEDFNRRDRILKSFDQYQQVRLWFEHDLYDQLQILQIVDFLGNQPWGETRLLMIASDHYLGMMTPTEMSALSAMEQPLNQQQIKLASQAWSALRQDTPLAWCELLQVDTTSLPFLGMAITRLLEEFPDSRNGLSRTARQALQTLSAGSISAARVFQAIHKQEERIFMGDSSFWVVLNEMQQGEKPLIHSDGQTMISFDNARTLMLELTDSGRQVLDGQLNWLNLTPINRWIGGVHLLPDRCWCWDSQCKTIRPC